MTKRNSLTAFKKVDRILPDTAVPDRPEPKRGAGRPPKPKAEKRSHKVQLAFTEIEGQISREKAGLAGEAPFIYAFLKEHGYFD
ncbi:MAG: hypothetical protein SVT56_13120 [Chloroflexota bacterium]|nr:hypothetical protein [Chloroflexota bacterium]